MEKTDLKILFVALGGNYPFCIGGPQGVAFNLIKQFSKKNVEIRSALGMSKNDLDNLERLTMLVA